MIRVACISDTHSRHDRVIIEPCDILLIAGDITNVGDLQDVYDFAQWLRGVPAKNIIVVAGNHDFCFENVEKRDEARHAFYYNRNVTYLENSSTELMGLKIWGSPWSPWFFAWAFNAKRGEEISNIWAKIPDNTDIIITHGPPFGYGDMTLAGIPAGCEDLTKRLLDINPRLHVSGHIHEAYGVRYMPTNDIQKKYITCVNASVCDFKYKPVHEVIYLDL